MNKTEAILTVATHTHRSRLADRAGLDLARRGGVGQTFWVVLPLALPAWSFQGWGSWTDHHLPYLPRREGWVMDWPPPLPEPSPNCPSSPQYLPGQGEWGGSQGSCQAAQGLTRPSTLTPLLAWPWRGDERSGQVRSGLSWIHPYPSHPWRDNHLWKQHLPSYYVCGRWISPFFFNVTICEEICHISF